MDAAAIAALTMNGLEEKEARAYLALLELGEAPVAEIAKRAELKRGIVYVVLDQLMARGLVSELPGRKVRQFIAAGPEKMLAVARSNALALQQFLPVLRAMQATGGGRPRIEIFEGREGVVSVYRQFELGKEARYLAATAQHERHFHDEVERWIRGYEAGTITTVGKNLINDDAAGRRFANRVNRTQNQAVRFLAKGIVVDLDLAIVDNRIGITSFDPLYIVVIHHPAIARSLAVLFDLAWERAERPPKRP
ncbi:MAG: helix-turn-helix domain-containing protein [Candidatus Uhrbacteria bacterium]